VSRACGEINHAFYKNVGRNAVL